MKFIPNNKRQGFTLTELSIVLGVIGIILGGIWTAATAARRSAKVAQSVNVVGSVVTSVRAYYGSSQKISTSPLLTAFAATLSDLTTSPFTAQICGWFYGLPPFHNTHCGIVLGINPGQYFAVEFTPPDLASCLSLAVKVTPATPVNGLKDVYINGCSAVVGNTGVGCATAATAATTGIPATVPFATAQCTTASTIDFVYTLRTPNTGF